MERERSGDLPDLSTGDRPLFYRTHAGHSPAMLEDILARIEKRLVAVDLTAARASRIATGNADTIRDLRRGLDGTGAKRTGIETETLARLAPVLKTTVTWLMSGTGAEDAGAQDATPDRIPPSLPLPGAMPANVPVMGTAAGSLGQGSFQLSPEPVDFVRRPPALEGARDIYAIFIEGESMTPEHRPGDLRFVHPHRKPAIGDTVIVQIRTHPGAEIQSYIKHLGRISAEFIDCRQINPAATIRFNRDTVVAIHKVLTMNDLFGV